MARSSGELAAAWSSAMVPQAASSTGSWRMNTNGLLPAPAAAPPLVPLLLPALSVMASLAYASSSACTGCGTNARQSSSRLNTSAKLKSAVGDVDDDVLLPSEGWVRRWRNSVMTSAFDSRAGQRSVAAGASAMVDRFRLDVDHLLRVLVCGRGI